MGLVFVIIRYTLSGNSQATTVIVSVQVYTWLLPRYLPEMV